MSIGTERARYNSNGKTNNTQKARKIKDLLEKMGQTDVHVWWEQIGPACEMCGNSGGYMFVSDQCSMQPIGLSFKEAMEQSQNDYYRVNVSSKVD